MTIESDLRECGLHEYADSVSRIEAFVRRAWQPGAMMPWFTDHGPEHSSRVAGLCADIANVPNLRTELALTVVERYVLHVAAWVHDLGMQSLLGRPAGDLKPEDYNRIRHEHPHESYRIVTSQSDLIGFPPDTTLVGLVATIAQAHGTRYFADSVEQLQDADYVRGERVRGPLLASILLMGDEMDLDSRRVTALPLSQESNVVSRAHTAKHRCVTRSGVTHQPQGRVSFGVSIEDPGGSETAAVQQLETWIVEKLRIQMAMVEGVFKNGFGGAAEFDRSVAVRYQRALGNPPTIPADVLRIVQDENQLTELIDHRQTMRTLRRIIDSRSVAVITGRLSGWEDVDGREDLRKAVAADWRLRGGLLFQADVLYESDGTATLRDVVSQLAPGQHDSKESYIDLTQKFLAAVREHDDCMVAISSIDRLGKESVLSLVEDVLRPINDMAHVSVILTSDQAAGLARLKGVEEVAALSLDTEELELYLRRYAGSVSARVEAHQELSYSNYKQLRQEYVAQLAGL